MICLFFGHKMSEDEFYSNNGLECCARCKICAHPYDGMEIFSERSYYGVIGYPIFAAKTKIADVYHKVTDRFRKKPDIDIPF